MGMKRRVRLNHDRRIGYIPTKGDFYPDIDDIDDLTVPSQAAPEPVKKKPSKIDLMTGIILFIVGSVILSFIFIPGC